MKLNIKGIVWWFLGIYFLLDPLREFLVKGEDPFYIFTNGLKGVIISITSIIPFFLFTLIAYLANFYFFKKKQFLKLLALSVLGFFVVVFLRYFLQQIAMDQLFGYTNYHKGVSLKYFIQDHVYFAIIYMSVGMIFYFVEYSRFKEKREQELQVAYQKMELSMLRSQINPHFLLNSMNNIYSLVYSNSKNALSVIEKLSNILKYTLYENKEKVLIREEMDHINNYIELQKLRFNFKINFDIDIDPLALECMIPPLLLLPLVENIFKHAELSNIESPATFTCKIKDDELHISATNLIKIQEKDKTGGIGLENIKKRLQLIYPETHNYKIKAEKDKFQVDITLKKDSV